MNNNNKNMKYKTLTNTELDTALGGLKGKFFTIAFYKNNGDLRELTGRFGVTKDLNGKGLKYDAKAVGNMIVYDMINHGYRTINRKRVVAIQSKGKIYSFNKVQNA
tara:strand:- start:2357 stop:2674 length:318 start_codon:yes stop_codon:yes gene_type:complete